VRASPDGYTLLWATSPNAINATFCDNLNYLFDYLVGGGEQIGRHGQAECLGGLEIDHRLVFGLLDRQIGGLSHL
jgi:hypothetical protein